MKGLIGTVVVLFTLALCATAQIKEDIVQGLKDNLGVGGGWVHVTGDGGLNGFNVNAEYMVVRPVSIVFNLDEGWNSSNLGVFQFTSTGAVATHSHLQDFLIGPRVYFPGTKLFKKSRLNALTPFAEAQFGGSTLSQKVSTATLGSVSASDSSFAWLLGGGGDLRLSQHWSFRPEIGLLRTHFSSSGQSHLRLSLGLVYTLRERRGSY